VEAVGEFDEDDADVVDHGEKHLADAFRLSLFARVEVKFGEFGDAIDALGDFGAEEFADFVDRDGGVFDGVVEEAGDEADRIHRHVAEDVSDFEGVGHVGLTGGAGLTGVVERGEGKSLAEGC